MKKIILILLLAATLAGCESQLKPITFDQAILDEPAQADGFEHNSADVITGTPVRLSNETAADRTTTAADQNSTVAAPPTEAETTPTAHAAGMPQKERPAATGVSTPVYRPAAIRYFPADRTDHIFDELLGTPDPVYFSRNAEGEVFLALDAGGEPSRAAQLRLIGSRDGYMSMLVGVEHRDGSYFISRVYIADHGLSLPGIQKFNQGKAGFLAQFASRNVFADSKKIDGITGATPIYEPVAAEIENTSTRLARFMEGSAKLADFKRRAKPWYRRPPQPPGPVPTSPAPQVAATAVQQGTTDTAGNAGTEPAQVQPSTSVQTGNTEPPSEPAADKQAQIRSQTSTPDLSETVTPDKPVTREPATVAASEPQSQSAAPVYANDDMPADDLPPLLPQESLAEFPSANLSADTDLAFKYWKQIAAAELVLLAFGVNIMIYSLAKQGSPK